MLKAITRMLPIRRCRALRAIHRTVTRCYFG
jgi:hypothetical protein